MIEATSETRWCKMVKVLTNGETEIVEPTHLTTIKQVNTDSSFSTFTGKIGIITKQTPKTIGTNKFRDIGRLVFKNEFNVFVYFHGWRSSIENEIVTRNLESLGASDGHSNFIFMIPGLGPKSEYSTWERKFASSFHKTLVEELRTIYTKALVQFFSLERPSGAPIFSINEVIDGMDHPLFKEILRVSQRCEKHSNNPFQRLIFCLANGTQKNNINGMVEQFVVESLANGTLWPRLHFITHSGGYKPLQKVAGNLLSGFIDLKAFPWLVPKKICLIDSLYSIGDIEELGILAHKNRLNSMGHVFETVRLIDCMTSRDIKSNCDKLKESLDNYPFNHTIKTPPIKIDRGRYGHQKAVEPNIHQFVNDCNLVLK